MASTGTVVVEVEFDDFGIAGAVASVEKVVAVAVEPVCILVVIRDFRVKFPETY